MPQQLTAFIWHFLRRHPLFMTLILLIVVIGSLEISLAPYILKIIVDTAAQRDITGHQFIKEITFPAGAYILLTLIHNAAMRSHHYLCIKILPQLRKEISVSLFDHLAKHSVSFFQQNFSGDLAQKVQNLAEGVESIVTKISNVILGNILTLICAFVLLSTVKIYFSIVLLLWIMIYLGNGYRLSKKTTFYAHDFAKASSTLTGQLVDSISNIVSAKVFGNVSHETSRVEEAVSQVGQADQRLQHQVNRTNFFQNLVFTTLITLLLAGLIYGRVHGWISIGDFAFVLGLCITIYTMADMLTKSMPDLARDVGRCRQALQAIIIPHEIQDVPNATVLKVSDGTICCKAIRFGYGKNKLFEQFNLDIQPKQKIGLIGYSGAGKTSLINLLFRLYDIEEGEISIDGQNIKSVTQASLMQNMALIPQHPELFHRSLMDNIRYGDTAASDEAVYHAAKLAKCHEFITQLPEGYASMVGEKGVTLSGGQRQRIAIARAILKNAPILILDEATSALDSATEKEIQDALHILMENKTVIVIAHRLSTILSMDRILFFDRGQIIEDGTVAELQHKNGPFSKLLAMQRVS